MVDLVDVVPVYAQYKARHQVALVGRSQRLLALLRSTISLQVLFSQAVNDGGS